MDVLVQNKDVSEQWDKIETKLSLLSDADNYKYPTSQILSDLGIDHTIPKLTIHQTDELGSFNIIIINRGLINPLQRWKWEDKKLYLYLSLREMLENMPLYQLTKLIEEEGVDYPDPVTSSNKETVIDFYVDRQIVGVDDLNNVDQINFGIITVDLPQPLTVPPIGEAL